LLDELTAAMQFGLEKQFPTWKLTILQPADQLAWYVVASDGFYKVMIALTKLETMMDDPLALMKLKLSSILQQIQTVIGEHTDLYDSNGVHKDLVKMQEMEKAYKEASVGKAPPPENFIPFQDWFKPGDATFGVGYGIAADFSSSTTSSWKGISRKPERKLNSIAELYEMMEEE